MKSLADIVGETILKDSNNHEQIETKGFEAASSLQEELVKKGLTTHRGYQLRSVSDNPAVFFLETK